MKPFLTGHFAFPFAYPLMDQQCTGLLDITDTRCKVPDICIIISFIITGPVDLRLSKRNPSQEIIFAQTGATNAS